MNIFACLPWRTLYVNYSKYTIVGAERGCRVGSAWGWSVPPTPTNGADHPPTNSPTTPGWPKRLQWRPRVLTCKHGADFPSPSRAIPLIDAGKHSPKQHWQFLILGVGGGQARPLGGCATSNGGRDSESGLVVTHHPPFLQATPTQPLEDKLKQV